MLRHLFTTADNVTWDLGRVLWAKMSVAYVFLTGLQIWHGVTITPTEWATGAGLVLSAGAGSLLLKKTTEPAP